MCIPAAAILTRTGIHWCETESHTDEIERLGLRDDGSAVPDFVRIEITPPDRDYRLPLDQWVYHVDQPQTPEWYTAATAEAAVRAELPQWIAAHVFSDGVHELRSGFCYAHNSASVYAYDSACVDAYGSARVYAYGSARVNAYNSARVYAYDSACCHAYSDSACSGKLSGAGHIVDMRVSPPRIIVAQQGE